MKACGASLKPLKKTKKDVLLRKPLRAFEKIKTVGRKDLGMVETDNACFLSASFPENDTWLQAHFVRAGQALHTQRRIWYIYHRQLAPKGGVVYEWPNVVGYRTTFCGTNITIGWSLVRWLAVTCKLPSKPTRPSSQRTQKKPLLFAVGVALCRLFDLISLSHRHYNMSLKEQQIQRSHPFLSRAIRFL